MDELTFESKPATLGVSLATPTQKHGDDRVPAKAIRIKGMMLDKAEFIQLCERIGVEHSEHAWDQLFNERKGKPAEPFWCGKVKHSIPGQFKHSAAEITFGISPYVVTFSDALVSRISLVEQLGGMISIDYMLSTLKRNITGDLSRLDDYLGNSANVALTIGPEDEDDEDDEEVDEDQESLDLTPVGKLEEEKPATRNRRKPSDGATVN